MLLYQPFAFHLIHHCFKELFDPLPLFLSQSSTGNPSSSSSEDDEDVSAGDREGYICAVCLDVYFSPYMCHPCNHIFCEPCLRTLAKNSPTNTPCPLCRTIITHVFFQKGEITSRKHASHELKYLPPPLMTLLCILDWIIRDGWKYSIKYAWQCNIKTVCANTGLCLFLQLCVYSFVYWLLHRWLRCRLFRGPSCTCPTGSRVDLLFSSNQMSHPDREDRIKHDVNTFI